MFKSTLVAGMKAFFLSASLLLFAVPTAFAAEDMMRTQKVKVGDKVPVTDSIRKPLEDGKPVVLAMLSNPMQCGGCDEVIAAIDEATKKHPEIAFLMVGGEDIRGALNQDTIVTKRAFGFVTMGEVFTFYIDGGGVLRKITLGRYTGPELEQNLDVFKGKTK